MRELWARLLALTTGALVVVLSIAFAAIQNPAGDAIAAPPTTAAADADPASLERGRAVYDAQDCARCHAIAGEGQRRSPLDDVGARLSREEIRQWITGADEVREDLPARALTAKQAYRELPADELDALIAYLASLGG